MNLRTLFTLLLLMTGAAQAEPLSAERVRFKQAWAAALAGKPQAKALARGLEHYLLYPYLKGEALRRDLPQLPVAQVERFLDEHRGTYVAARLRDAWLRESARQHQWALYQHFYQPSTNADLACIALRADFELGKLTALNKAAKQLWLTGKPPSEACEPVFEGLHAAGAIPDDLIRQRVWLALREGRGQFAGYLLGQFVARGPDELSLLQAINRQPTQAAALPALKEDTPNTRLWLAYAVGELAAHDAWAARDLWRRIAARDFTPRQRGTVTRTLALAAFTQRENAGLDWFDDIPETGPDEVLERTRLRAALEARDWRRVERWTDDDEPAPANRLRLAYWHARALERLNRKPEAAAAFETLTAERDYYGFLACDRLGVPYSFRNRAITPTPRELAALKALPGLQRAREFQLLGLRDEANREWRWQLEQLSRREVEVAARLAYDWGWYDRAIFALGRIDSFDDLEIRFPTLFRDSVLASARARDLPPARVYSIIRGESAFVVDARSPVGALGLMQLMPATGTEMAKRLGVKLRTPNELLVPEKNIQLGSGYLQQVLRQFDGNFALAAAAYNAGPTRVRSWLKQQGCQQADVWVEIIPFAETEAYVRRALFYEALYAHRLGAKVENLSAHLGYFGTGGAQRLEC